MRYPYPYFADEWYAIALIKDSIVSHSLPLWNPLDAGRPRFLNFEFAFHSFLAELMVLLGLNPLTGYTLLTMFSGLLICLLVYIFLIFDGAARWPAAITAPAILYITNGANLAGIWTLIPLIAGMVCLLLSLFFFVAGQKGMIWFMAVLTILFYPPLVPFYTVAVISFLGTSRELSPRKVSSSMLWYVVFLVCVGSMLLMPAIGWEGKAATSVSRILLSKIFPSTFPPNSITRLAIGHVIPVSTIIFSILGIFAAARPRPWLTAMVLLGLGYWAVYSRTTFRLILDYPRVVVATSILLALVAGYGLNWLI